MIHWRYGCDEVWRRVWVGCHRVGWLGRAVDKSGRWGRASAVVDHWASRVIYHPTPLPPPPFCHPLN